MKKFMLDTRAALGVAPKTIDNDYDEMAASVRAINRTLSEYLSGIENMKSACQNLMMAMEGMSKIFETMTAGNGIPESMKSLAAHYTELTRMAQTELLVDYKKALEDDESITEIRKLLISCKTLETRRNKVRNEYDTYRDAVNRKETVYKRKGKSLSESKVYEGEVSMRDSLKVEYEKADKEFKDKYMEVSAMKASSYKGAMAVYLESFSQLMTSVEKGMEATKKKIDVVEV
ncbi:hypothetical protein Q4I28_003564 [Leishmania naiffi]|uniref:BAR domain-containing protein n=1 Tax=Leishmania naiffi TaxID=5678 RepID=A0AAW3BRQ4_9TRYP